MAESEEEVDVEDISDGEQISHLRDLAEEDQKDNWYDKEIGNQNFLNRSSSPFSSDYCDPNSWLLDTNTVWSLDTCTDDKSRATIEKMILEEQMYAYRSVPMKPEKPPTETGNQKQSCIGRLPNAKKNIVKTARGEPSMTHRKPWTEEEQELFEQGLVLYGRSWTKIANMIDTRTTLQVKNYAKQYFKHKSKNLTKPQVHVTQGIEQQFDEAFVVVANHEEIVTENSEAEDEPTIQTTIVSLDGAKGKPEYESDEDVEVDIDGFDNEEQCNNLIPGQTTSCPDVVYSALVRAAATEENMSELGTEEESMFTRSEVDHIDVSSGEKSPSSLQQKRNSSVIDHSSARTVNIEEMNDSPSPACICRETIPLAGFKSGGEEKSTVNDISRSNTFNSGDDLSQDYHGILTSELQFCGSSHECNIDTASDNTSSLPTNVSHVTDPSCCVTLDTCHVTSAGKMDTRHVTSAGKSVDEDVHASNIIVGSVETSAQGTESGSSAVEKSWAPVTCGEVACSEFIQPSDRQQPGASAGFFQPSDLQQPGTNAENHNTLYKEIVIDRNIIQDLEKEHNMEFFMGRALKTPERYMKIRNYILAMWERTKPSYLFKTAVRGGLRNCGDVNSIGRVHAFLEDIGAINEGCFDKPVPRVRQQGEATDPKENVHMESWVNSLRPRKKRPRDKDGDWVDFSKPEGMTIQHLYPEEHAPQYGVPNEKGSPSPPRKRPSRNKPSYDPFLLVPCRKFPSPSAMPFDVLIQSETLVVMDTHAHMSTTEVIGLLGGNYSHVTRLLKVSKAIPCRSLSTGLQCEMDPVSQTQASEDLAHRGLAVVGWYHSHPTFAPIPSVRDIETQAKFQEWFGKGGAPFIGIIVSPYNYSNPSNQSQIRCLTVSDEWESAGQYRLPYQFDYEVHEDEADEDDTVEQVRSIADDYRTYPFRVQLNRRFGSSKDLNLLDKLLDSLRTRVNRSDDDKREAFLNRLKNTISENIIPYQLTQPSE